MKIQFYIRFHTNFGETLHITGNAPAINNNTPGGVLLQYLDAEHWGGSFEVDPAEVPHLQYKYLLRLPDGSLIEEGGNDRIIDLSKKGIEEINVHDIWNNPAEYENAFYSAPFQKVFFRENHPKVKTKAARVFTHIFKVKAPLLRKNEVVCLCGSIPALGEWKTSEPLLLSKDDHWWSVKADLSGAAYPVQYKYGVYDVKKKAFVRYEHGENRVWQGNISTAQLTILQDGFIHLPNTTWRGAGVAIPVFSLRSKNSFGVGEFTDLKLLADWAAETGQHLIQILPINDTIATNTWADSYPYAAISAFALHPIYINLELVAGKEYADIIKPLRKKQKQLNELADLDYEEVLRTKMAVLKVLFAAQKETFLKDPEFLDFFNKSKHWLVPYAAFSYLRDKNGTPDSSQWKIYSKYDQAAIEKYVSPRAKHYNEIATYYFIQYHLHLQLKEASAYAHKKGIALKGDIPIGIYRYSCDAWMAPELYNMQAQAGAPPDDFAVKGQNWGFPTYNWRKMEEDGFTWWRQRFEQMSNYFDAFRIDHILGFFRIWSIPLHAVEGIMGYFEPALPVRLNEITERGIWFDYNRFVRPYITEPVLNEIFGEMAEMVKANYLDYAGFDRFNLKEAFNTQRKVEAYFTQQEQSEANNRVKTGLYDLISNIILFEVEGSKGEEFHFRISMEHTASYKHLDANTQQQLKELYINYFFRRQDRFWEQEAMRKLPALKAATNMLICGEDLGMVPACVPDVMKRLNFLSLEIQRMPKNPGLQFFNPASAPYLSVVTPSTHDMSTVRGWWEEDHHRTQLFYNLELGQPGQAPTDCGTSISKMIIQQHLYSPAMFCIFQLQDITGMEESLRRPDAAEERINVPANPKHYWRYRMHFTLEHLLKEKQFNTTLKQYIKESGRG